MKNDILRGKRVHVREIVHHHRQQVAMGQHCPLGLTSGARGIEQPGQIVWIDLSVGFHRV